MADKVMPLADKFDLIEDAFMRIFANLREVDSASLDEESAGCLLEAYEIADIFNSLLSSNITWREAKARYDSIVWG